MRLPVLSAVLLALSACPRPTVPDSGMMEVDSGPADAGRDAGLPVRDAGVDAGWVSVPISEWCRSYALARCWRDLRCGRLGASLLDACVAQKSFGCDPAAYARSSAEGRHTYDATRAADCLDAFDRGSCEAQPSACDGVFIGRTGPDGGALVPEDCDRDAGFFDIYDNRCPHRCQPWSAEGERCSDNAGEFFPSCKPGVHGCEYFDAGFERICMAPHRDGEECQSFDSCELGLICNGGTCIKQYGDAGEACDVMNGYPFCGAETFCRQGPPDMMGELPPGVCQKKPGLGGVCSGGGSCLPSLRCSSTIGTGTCQVRAGLGEPCSTNVSIYADCQDGLYCPNSTSRCAPLPGDGGDCSQMGSYFECAPGYYCDGFPNYICQRLHGDGEPCSYNATCLSNECLYGTFPDGGNGYRCVRCAQMADGG